MSKIKAVVSSFGLLAIAFLTGSQSAYAQYSTTTAGADVTTLVTDVGSTFGVVIIVILAFLAALIGLGMGIRYFKRWIGRK